MRAMFGGGSIFWIASLLGGAIVAAVARRRRETLSFAVAIVAALLLTPILWLHYLALLAAVAAVLRPTFGVSWLLPLAAWVPAPQGSFYGGNWRTVVIGLLILATFAAALDPLPNGWGARIDAIRPRWSERV